MNRSAKDEARSSQHYGGEGKPVHSSNQGACGWHEAEDQYVTPGDLIRFSYGNEISDSISESEMRNKVL